MPKVSAVLTVLSAVVAASARPPAQPRIANVGTVYDGPDLPLADGYLDPNYIKNLLGHFGMRGELVRLAEYQPGQLANYRAAFYKFYTFYIFYISSVRKTRLPESFLKDIRDQLLHIAKNGRIIRRIDTCSSRGQVISVLPLRQRANAEGQGFLADRVLLLLLATTYRESSSEEGRAGRPTMQRRKTCCNCVGERV
jgi:hypothetical protein